MSQTESITKENLCEGLKSNGQKLGLLIAALPASREEKEAWLEIVKFMSLDQIDSLAEILETLYAHNKTAEIDESFKNELAVTRDKYEERGNRQDKETTNKISKLSEEIL